MAAKVSADSIRAQFSDALSSMYREEVPLYADLIAIVDQVNEATLAADPALFAALARNGEIDRLSAERHGAIRVGTPEELAALRRVFAVMGMEPVGYYDLSVAGVPMHSTAFRPVSAQALRLCPFRVFTSLLRLDLIADEALRTKAQDILSRRCILSERALALTACAEEQGGLTHDEAAEFVEEVTETFRWHAQASVDAETYAQLLKSHRLIADVVCFKGPHINHLTPRTLDIDSCQVEMLAQGMQAKAVIEGPPPRHVPILLRQTSFNALSETIRFADHTDGTAGAHTARFGEIEQRGIALTAKGRALYDELLATARGETGAQGPDYVRKLADAFAAFPDDPDSLRRQGLAFFRYTATERRAAGPLPGNGTDDPLEIALMQGLIEAVPMTYEDFLPVSAAGIFQSNLAQEEQRAYAGNASQHSFEAALGTSVIDPMDLYAKEETRSRDAALSAIRVAPAQ